MKTSDRINKMPISSIMELYPIADKRKSEGITVHHLNIGDPDIKTPREFFNAIKNYDVETIGYAPARG
ncbi:MAG: pyridoxal phosphate-dependent aminotransferase, partial [Neofamilia sp.]